MVCCKYKREDKLWKQAKIPAYMQHRRRGHSLTACTAVQGQFTTLLSQVHIQVVRHWVLIWPAGRYRLLSPEQAQGHFGPLKWPDFFHLLHSDPGHTIQAACQVSTLKIRERSNIMWSFFDLSWPPPFPPSWYKMIFWCPPPPLPKDHVIFEWHF